jgi:cation diffusion facilitator family transporter
MDIRVRRVLLVEGGCNLAVLVAKAVVGFSTGSLALLGDAIHSLADLANNVVALVVVKLAAEPPDREHPYGHQKFETLAVFGVATLLAVLSFELFLRAIEPSDREIVDTWWGLAVMAAVLGVNIFLAIWERRRARALSSEILNADAQHTFADVLTTILVVAGWQLATRGFVWLDRLFAIFVSGVVMYLAYGLFRRAIPVLVDRISLEPETVTNAVLPVAGVREVRRVRSRWAGSRSAVEVVVTVAPELPTKESHEIADAIEDVLKQRLDVHDVTVHVEPDDGKTETRS